MHKVAYKTEKEVYTNDVVLGFEAMNGVYENV